MLAFTNGLPKPDNGAGQEQKAKRNIVGVASHIVANSLLRHNIDSNMNFVFSPLGFSSILAILREGARGDTLTELEQGLKFPDSIEEIRESYATALNHLSASNPSMAPQFKTWFYIYKNNSVESTFKQMIEGKYGVEVKDINRFEYDFAEPNTSQNDFTYPTTTGFAGLEFSDEVDVEKNTERLDPLKEELIKAEEEIKDKKEASKFDRVVDDKQYVEVPVIKEEIAREMTTTELQDNATELPIGEEAERSNVLDDEPISTEVPLSSEPELSNEIDAKPVEQNTEQAHGEDSYGGDIVPTTDQLDPNSEIMQAVESHIVRKRTKSAIIEDDVASALSGNSIVGKKTDSEDEYESKMLLFNGLYFRGNWAAPFQVSRSCCLL